MSSRIAGRRAPTRTATAAAAISAALRAPASRRSSSAAGRASREELLDACGSGLYVREISAGHTDPESGRFSLFVESADLVRRGRLGAPVAPFLLTSDVLTALRHLYGEPGEASAPASGLGLCVKHGEPLPVGGASPAVLLRGLTVARGAAVKALSDGLFEDVLGAASSAAHDGVGGEVYERRGTALELVEDERGLHASVSSERGFAVRQFRAGRTSFAASGADGARALPAEARLLLARARTRRGAHPASALPGAAPPAPLAPPPRPDEIAARGLLVAFRRALAAASDGAVLLGEAALALGARTERVATTAGRDVVFGSAFATLVATVSARTGAGRASARVVAAAALPEELALARLAHHAVDRVLLPLRGRPLEPGRWDLLLDPLVAAPLVARVAPAFFGEDEDGLLAARTRDGRDALASPALTLVDAASAPGGPVRTTHDGEGTPQRRTVVLDRGRLAAASRTSPPPSVWGPSPRATRSAARSPRPPRSGSRTSSSTPRPGSRPSTSSEPSSRGSTRPCFCRGPRSTSRRTASACTSPATGSKRGARPTPSPRRSFRDGSRSSCEASRRSGTT